MNFFFKNILKIKLKLTNIHEWKYQYRQLDIVVVHPVAIRKWTNIKSRPNKINFYSQEIFFVHNYGINIFLFSLSFSNKCKCFMLCPKCSCCMCHFQQSRTILIRTSFRDTSINIRKWLTFSIFHKTIKKTSIFRILALFDYKMYSLPY